jgi:hypothetical protein
MPSWAPFAWWVESSLSSQPCRAFPRELPFAFVFETPQCSLDSWISSARGYWLTGTTWSFMKLTSRATDCTCVGRGSLLLFVGVRWARWFRH